MKNIKSKTLEEHREYLYEIVRLKLFWMHGYLNMHPEETFSNVLRNRVDIYRKTNVNLEGLNPSLCRFDSEDWLKLERAAERIFEKNRANQAVFEEEAFRVFQPAIDARAERDFMDKSGLAGYQCGSLRHEWTLNEGAPFRTLGFHIANAIAPHSIFEKKSYLANCLLLLCDAAEVLFGAEEISTCTWLNQVPAWLEYFPEEWRRNMRDPLTNIQWHYGYWGQFISARGVFNKKYGDFLRRTGKFPFYPCASHCSINSLRHHLEPFRR